ncbi:MAG: hypothetical protein ABI257_03245 [Nitrosospira sp.]
MKRIYWQQIAGNRTKEGIDMKRPYLRQYAVATQGGRAVIGRYPYKMVLNFGNCVITKGWKIKPKEIQTGMS